MGATWRTYGDIRLDQEKYFPNRVASDKVESSNAAEDAVFLNTLHKYGVSILALLKSRIVHGLFCPTIARLVVSVRFCQFARGVG